MSYFEGIGTKMESMRRSGCEALEKVLENVLSKISTTGKVALILLLVLTAPLLRAALFAVTMVGLW